MTATINVNVETETGAFDAFAAKFRAYTEKLDATPGAMAKVSRSSEETVVSFQALAAALSDQADAIGKIAGGSTTLRQNTEVTARHWQDLRLSTQGVAQNIKEATASLLKWSGVTALIGGITGGIAAYGFSNIAESVSGGRTAAMGVGATYGGRASFLTNFGRLPDAEGFLSRINAAQTDPNKGVALRVLGLTGANATGDSADVGANAILQLKKLVGTKGDGFDERFLADKLHANRADELIDVNFAQTLRGMSPKEVDERVAAYRAAKPKLALGEDTQKKYQDFMTRMRESSNRIENTFVKNLANLTPSMTALAKAFARVVDVLMKKDGPLSDFLKKLNDGVEWLAKHIDTPEFQKSVESFIAGVVRVARATADFLAGLLNLAKWFGVTPASAAEGGSFRFGSGNPADETSRVIGGGRAALGRHIGMDSGGGPSAGRGATGPDPEHGMPGAGGVPGAVFDLAARGEAASFPGGGYNTIIGGGQLPLTDMTLKQVMALHRDAGRWQLTAPTIAEFIKKLHLTGDEKFTPEMQKKIIGALLAETHGSAARLKGRFVSLRRTSDAEIDRAWHTPDAPKAEAPPKKDDAWKKTAFPDVKKSDDGDRRDLFAETPTNREAPRARGPSNTHTRVTITKPTGADPSTSAAAAVAP